MTTDEELNDLEDNLRRLKIEYESYFNGGSPRPPNDLVFRVEKTIKRYSAGTVEISFRQRFKFNQLTQSYAVHGDLWRRKLKIKESGLSASSSEPREAAKKEKGLSVVWTDPDQEQEKVERLLRAIIEAKSSAGEPVDDIDPKLFASFIREKTRQLRESLDCDLVQFTVTIESGRVKLRAGKALESGRQVP